MTGITMMSMATAVPSSAGGPVDFGTLTVGTAHVDAFMGAAAFDYYGFTNDSVINSGVPFGSLTAPPVGLVPTRLFFSTQFGAGSTILKLQSGTYDGFSVSGMGEVYTGLESMPTNYSSIYLTIGGVTATLTRSGFSPYSYSASTDPFSLASKVGQTLPVLISLV